jgi:DNA-binding PadR family transcriptional regulator
MTPLQEPTFLVLAALAGESLHGYGIIQRVTELSDGRVQLRAGTLYPALDRLATDGLVELEREEVVDNRLRRYYRLTEARLAARSAVASPVTGPVTGPATTSRRRGTRIAPA